MFKKCYMVLVALMSVFLQINAMDDQQCNELLSGDELCMDQPRCVCDTAGRSLLHEAAAQVDQSMVAELLKQGYPVNSISQDRLTPLCSVAKSFNGRVGGLNSLNAKMARYLIKEGASLTLAGPLLWAAARGNTPVAATLLQSGSNIPNYINRADSRGRAALHCAIGNLHAETAFALVQWGADPLVQDNDGIHPVKLFFSMQPSWFNNYQAYKKLFLFMINYWNYRPIPSSVD